MSELFERDGEIVRNAIADAMVAINMNRVDISDQISTIRTGHFGADIRMAIVDALQKLATEIPDKRWNNIIGTAQILSTGSSEGISISNYPCADVQNVSVALKDAIDSLQIFDAGVIEVDESETTLTFNKSNVSHLAVSFSGDSEECTYRDGSTLSVQHVGTSSDKIWIGTCGDSVIFSFQTTSRMLSTVVTKSEDGSGIILHSGITNHKMYSLSEDSETTYVDEYTPIVDQKWVSFLGICADSISKNIVRANDVFRLYALQNGLIDIYSEGAEYKRFVLDGDLFLTDGYFVLRNREGW